MDKKQYYFKEDDSFGRDPFAKFLKNLINDCDDFKRQEDYDSYVIAIDSGWGTGKSYFLSMFENYLNGKTSKEDIITNEMFVIHYNSWENDFWNNAFEPLADKIMNELKKWYSNLDPIEQEKKKLTVKEVGYNLLKIARVFGKGFLKTKVKKKFGKDGEEVFEEFFDTTSEVTDDMLDKYALSKDSSLFDDYYQFKEAINGLSEALTSVIKDSGKKMVIVIDELDRCRPDFAVSILEIVKHIFNVKGLVFVFALDVKQLGHAIKGIYGEGMDSTGYLTRFFNYYSKLPVPRYLKYIEKSLSFIDDGDKKDYVIRAFNKLQSDFTLSTRDIDTISKSYEIMVKQFLYKYKNESAWELYLVFLVIKYKQQVEYSKFEISSYINDNYSQNF